MEDLRSKLELRRRLEEFLEEDIGSGDITSNLLVPASLRAKGEIVCKSSGATVSGLEEAALVFEICDCDARVLTKDGSSLTNGQAVLKLAGNARAILKAERTALNLLMRMSGIATETKRVSSLARGVKILATRKTAPGLRYFDKKAVIAGGGGAHRIRLDDMVLIKDNHLELAGPAGKCVRTAKKGSASSMKVECEVRNTKEAVEAVSAGADIVMLDNFAPSSACSTIKELTRLGLRKKCKIEISGGVNERNIRQFAKCKPDFISLGYITHSPKAVDFSLEMRL